MSATQHHPETLSPFHVVVSLKFMGVSRNVVFISSILREGLTIFSSLFRGINLCRMSVCSLIEISKSRISGCKCLHDTTHSEQKHLTTKDIQSCSTCYCLWSLIVNKLTVTFSNFAMKALLYLLRTICDSRTSDGILWFWNHKKFSINVVQRQNTNTEYCTKSRLTFHCNVEGLLLYWCAFNTHWLK